jgi:hypothetical protein
VGFLLFLLNKPSHNVKVWHGGLCHFLDHII